MCANIADKKFSRKVWHERFCRQYLVHVRNFLRRNMVDFIDSDLWKTSLIISLPVRTEHSTKCGEIIHADVCGPIQVSSIGGSRYFFLPKDDFSHYRFIYCIKRKFEVQTFLRLVKKSFGCTISV